MRERQKILKKFLRFERNDKMDEPEGRARMKQPEGLKGNPYRQSLRGHLGKAKTKGRAFVDILEEPALRGRT